MGREGAVFGNADEEQRRGVRVELQTGYCTVWTCRRESKERSEKTARKQRGNKEKAKRKQRGNKEKTKGIQRENKGKTKGKCAKLFSPSRVAGDESGKRQILMLS